LSLPPSPLSFIPFSFHSWNSFNRHHFCICIHVYTFFALYSPPIFYTVFSLSPPPSPFSLVPPLSTPPPQDLFCPPVLRFCRRKKIKNAIMIE
jgi:hypothetical protein